MSLVSSSIPSFLNGVSQQAPAVRLPSQGSIQENAISNPADGLGKRLPTQHIARLLNYVTDWPLVHFYDRDGVEQYVMVFSQEGAGGRVGIWDLSGKQYRVDYNLPDISYLNCTSPATELACLTIADTTFVVNKTTTTAMLTGDGSTAPNPGFGALVWVKAGNYSTTYTVSINGRNFTHVTPDGIDATDAGSIQTDVIAQALYDKLKSLPSATWKVLYRPGDSVIWLNRKDQASFVAETSDGFSGHNLSVITDSVQSFTDLPAVAHGNVVVKVKGDFQSQADDYYVRFDCNDPTASLGPGVWTETLAPGTPWTLDPRTMPHLIKRVQDATTGEIYFSFEKAKWAYRQVGDETTAPTPSFVGQTINDIFLHRGRLGILAGTQIVMSRASDFLNFWRETVLQTLDSDPIDGTAATQEVVALRHAVPLNEELLLFGDKNQEVLKGDDLLTPKTFSLHPATSYAADRHCRPILVENVVYFPFASDSYSGVREYYADQQSGKDSTEITQHVPRYIPGLVYKLTASTVSNVLLALSSTDRQSAYVYQWLWNGTDKVQSAWGRWDLGTDSRVLGAEFIGGDLYLVTDRITNLCLEKIALTSRQDQDTSFVTHLDRRITDGDCPHISYNPRKDVTTLELPYRPNELPAVASRADAGLPDWKPAVLFPVIEEVTYEPPPPPDDPPPVPTVTILPTIPFASEVGPVAGEFTVYRDGTPDLDLTVRLVVSGTATPTDDYTAIADTVVIPSGSLSVRIPVSPVADAITEDTETVILSIAPDDSYNTGSPDSATVYISDGTPIPPPPVSPPPPPPASPPPGGYGVDCSSEDWTEGVSGDVFASLETIVDDNLYAPPEGSTVWSRRFTQQAGTPPAWVGADINDSPVSVTYDGYQILQSEWIPIITSACNTTTGKVEWSLSVYFAGYPGTEITLVFSGTKDPTSGPGPIGVYTNTATPPAGGDGSSVTWPTTMTITGTLPSSPPSPPAGTPNAPTSLTANAVDTDRIDLTWTDNSTDEQGFEIQRSYNGVSDWERLSLVPAGIVFFPDLPVQGGTTYYYRVRAYNASGYSSFTPVASATTEGSTPQGNDLTVTMANTGQNTVSSFCGEIDVAWTVDGTSARIHYNDGSAPWLSNDSDHLWISHDFYTSDVIQATDIIRNYSTSVTIGADVDLTEFALPFDVSVDDEIAGVLVNGIACGLTLSGAGPYYGLTTTLTIPATAQWQHGTNTVTIQVKNLANAAIPNPTGLLLKWGTPTVSPMPGVPSAKVESLSAVTLASIDPTVATDPNDFTYKIKVRGDLTGKPLWIGMPYTFKYQMSPLVLHTQSPNGQAVASVTGRLQLRNVFLSVRQTGYLRVEVTPAFRQKFSAVYADRTVGTPTTRIGDVPSGTGTFRFSVGSKADQVQIDLLNDSILPSWLIAANWEGFYVDRSRKI